MAKEYYPPMDTLDKKRLHRLFTMAKELTRLRKETLLYRLNDYLQAAFAKNLIEDETGRSFLVFNGVSVIGEKELLIYRKY
ncbi:hypothetical protein [Mucilaginibacter sp. UYCu711]|uniref:hypothetical protein n=1 Tax=Mucilaginibacter sp. UYCu711 TaxID=3156339 RepID=UPI003D22852B